MLLKKDIFDTYYLKHKDTTLITFKYLTEGLSKGNIEIININNEKRNYLPYTLKDLDNDSLQYWLSNRSIPKNRTFVKEILQSLNLEEHDTRGILDVTKGLSLNDVYWICPAYEQNIKFNDINLYENDFSEILSLIAFTGVETKINKLISSPELSTNGMLPKCWRRIQNDTYLYKGGTKGYANSGKEPYFEYYLSQIASKMELNHVDYELVKWKGIVASSCKNFTDINHSYVPIGYVVTKGGISAVNDYIKALPNTNIYKKFQDYILFSSLIINNDSHYGNFGFLVNNDTNEIEDFAPIFDNGGSIFSYALLSELSDKEKLKEYVNINKISYFGISYDILVKEICSPDQISKLNSLNSFHFQREKVKEGIIFSNEPQTEEKCLKNVEEVIKERARHYIDILEQKKIIQENKEEKQEINQDKEML